MDDTTLFRVVFYFLVVFTEQLFAALVSSGGNRRLAVAALHNRDFVVWTGHFVFLLSFPFLDIEKAGYLFQISFFGGGGEIYFFLKKKFPKRGLFPVKIKAKIETAIVTFITLKPLAIAALLSEIFLSSFSSISISLVFLTNKSHTPDTISKIPMRDVPTTIKSGRGTGIISCTPKPYVSNPPSRIIIPVTVIKINNLFFHNQSSS